MRDPGLELLSRKAAGGHVEHQLLLFVDASDEFGAVEDQEYFHRGVGHAFVPIEKRMIQREREPQGCGVGGQRVMQVGTIEGRFRLRERRFERGQVTQAWGATRAVEEGLVQGDDFADRQIPHQARRRYSSWFLASTRLAAARKPASGLASRSLTAARASSSGESPSRSA